MLKQGWYATLLKAANERPVFAPNSTFSNASIENRSRSVTQPFEERFEISYSARAREALIDMQRRVFAAIASTAGLASAEPTSTGVHGGGGGSNGEARTERAAEERPVDGAHGADLNDGAHYAGTGGGAGAPDVVAGPGGPARGASGGGGGGGSGGRVAPPHVVLREIRPREGTAQLHVYAPLVATDDARYHAVRQELLLQIVELIEAYEQRQT